MSFELTLVAEVVANHLEGVKRLQEETQQQLLVPLLVLTVSPGLPRLALGREAEMEPLLLVAMGLMLEWGLRRRQWAPQSIGQEPWDSVGVTTSPRQPLLQALRL